jgi:ribosomal protein S18 acetylase RimI-like enzyme
MPLTIRPATKDDAPIISALNTDVQALHAEALPWRFKPPGPDTFTPRDAEDLLAQPGHVAWLAFVDDAPAGYLVAEIVRRPESPRHHAHAMVYVHQLSVRPGFRKRGAGRVLLDAAKQHGETLDISILALDTWSFNEAAIGFFQRYGLTAYNQRMWNREG